MSETVRVVPVEGRRVRDPRTGDLLPEQGAEVVVAGYWARRIQAGDVEVAAAKRDDVTPKSAKSTGGKA